MKKTISILAVLAISIVGLHAQTTNLVISPPPPPHASAALTEAQFDAIVSIPALPSGKTSADVAGFSLFGVNLNVRCAPISGITLSEQTTLTSSQVASIVAALPPLPSGEVAGNIRSITLMRTPTGKILLIQFSQ
jgi:hypothetical protein